MDVTGVTVHRWETGKAPVTVQNYFELSKLYGADEPGQLMFPPKAKEEAAVLRRAHRIIQSLSPERLDRWLGVGEDAADVKQEK